MPGTVADLTAGITDLDAPTISILVGFSMSEGPRKAERRAGSLLADRAWQWPLLDIWNTWAVANNVTFYLWTPSTEGIATRQRVLVLVHTIFMLSTRERDLDGWTQANSSLNVGIIGVRSLVAKQGDCALCLERADQPRYDLSPTAAIAPHHPGCRCARVPIFERGK